MKVKLTSSLKTSYGSTSFQWETIAEAYEVYPDICAIGLGPTKEESKSNALNRYANMVEARNSAVVEEVELDI